MYVAVKNKILLMLYSVELKPSAIKDLKSFDRTEALRITEKRHNDDYSQKSSAT